MMHPVHDVHPTGQTNRNNNEATNDHIGGNVGVFNITNHVKLVKVSQALQGY